MMINIRGVNLRYEVVGEHGPWLALVTGARRTFTEVESLAGRLAREGFRVLLHDRRNTGASDILIEGEQGEEEIWADDLAVLLQRLDAAPAFIGGTSSGARLSMLTCLRHPQVVRGLLLMRVTGGAFAAGRLPGMYYGQFIEAARAGGMAAVCATEQYQERIAANPANGERLMAMDPHRYIAVMQHWLDIFQRGPRAPVLGMTEEQLRAIVVPTIVVPGNDMTHSSANGVAAARLISGSVLLRLPVQDQEVPLLPFAEWAAAGREDLLARGLADFMRSVLDAPAR
jgi:pimeloyl-ACP methyl ester carboxylesterase